MKVCFKHYYCRNSRTKIFGDFDMPIFVCKFNKNYEVFLRNVYEYIIVNFAQDFYLSSLTKIEIVDSLPGSSDGRMVDANNILLSKRLYGLLSTFDIEALKGNDDFNSIVGTLYHELCHINEQTIMPNIHSVCYNDETNIEYCVALFWIEYIVELKTNTVLKRNNDKFCNDVASCDWKINKFNFEDADTSNYFYLLKVLPYVLANCYNHKSTTYFDKIKNSSIRNMAIELNDAVLEILKEYPFDDINKLHKIKTVFLTYKKQMVG